MSKKILVVDDDRFYSLYLNTLLRKNFPEYTLLMAGDGEEAWEILRSNTWSSTEDMVIIDLEMPKMNGYGLMKRITKELPVIPKLVVNSNYKFRERDLEDAVLKYSVAHKPLNSSKVRDVLQIPR
ncbi:MAG: response regulator [Bacteroidota bacterium]